MQINSVNQLFNEKMQDINSRIPANSNVNNKFQSLLEKAKLKTSSTDSTYETNTSISKKSDSSDISSILKTMLATQSSLNSVSMFSSDSSSSMFPTSTVNSNINSLQQAQLLKVLENFSNANE